MPHASRFRLRRNCEEMIKNDNKEHGNYAHAYLSGLSEVPAPITIKAGVLLIF